MASMTPMSLADVVKQSETQSQALNAKNLAAENEIRGIYDQLISRYKPGGADYERSNLLFQQEQQKGVGAKTHSLMSRGLSNTTLDPGSQWMSDTGNALAASLEDVLSSRYSQAMMGKAGFLNSIERTGMDPGALGSYMSNIGPTRTIVNNSSGSLWNRTNVATPGVYNNQPTTASGAVQQSQSSSPAGWMGGGLSKYLSGTSTNRSTNPTTVSQAVVDNSYQSYVAAVKSFSPTAGVIDEATWRRLGSPSGAEYLERNKG